MKYAYDLHIHSALSPCADDDMTPNNIAGMAAIKGLGIISVTDHNSCGNVRAVMAAAEQYGVIVVPGMEIETEEEVHVVSYFPSVDAAEEMQNIINQSMLGIKNQPETFGNQLYMNESDEIVGIEENLLVSATTLSFQDVFEKVRELGGLAVPAHIDRQSYSVLSNLGFLPPDVDIKGVEITKRGLEKYKDEYAEFSIITNSDAHNLGDIAEKERFLDIYNKNTCEITDFFVKYFLDDFH